MQSPDTWNMVSLRGGTFGWHVLFPFFLFSPLPGGFALFCRRPSIRFFTFSWYPPVPSLMPGVM
jgi:hypothetical protein